MQSDSASSGRLARSKPKDVEVGRPPLRRRALAALAGSLTLAAVLMPTSAAVAMTPTVAEDPEDAALAFDLAAYTTISVTVDGQPTPVRWYRELCYVANPVAAAAQQPGLGGGSTTIANTRCGYQSINVFVPERVAADQRTPIYFAVNNAGWASSYIRASVANGAVLQQHHEQRRRGAEGGLRLRRRRQPQPQPRRRRRLSGPARLPPRWSTRRRRSATSGSTTPRCPAAPSGSSSTARAAAAR